MYECDNIHLYNILRKKLTFIIIEFYNRKVYLFILVK